MEDNYTNEETENFENDERDDDEQILKDEENNDKKNELDLSKVKLYFGILFGGISFLISFIGIIVSHTGFGDKIFRLLFYPLLFFGLGYLLAVLLIKFVPELFGAEEEIEYEEEEETGLGGSIDTVVGEEQFEDTSYEDQAQPDEISLEEPSTVEPTANANLATDTDYISIGDAKIPKEPEMLAKAVRTMMSEDE